MAFREQPGVLETKKGMQKLHLEIGGVWRFKANRCGAGSLAQRMAQPLMNNAEPPRGKSR
jgi:hypothetical protein